MDPLKVSIVVTCRNNAATIGECLQSLKDQTYPSEAVEILVLDACSIDGTLEIAKQYTEKTLSLSLNAAAAYNYAMKVVSYDIMGFVDADAKVEADWLQKLVPHLSDPKVAGASGAIETWNTDNHWARAIGYELKSRYSRIGKYTRRIATMNLVMKKNVIEAAGGWDENFPSQYDTDLGYRVSALGYHFVYEPSAKCFHFNRPNLRAYWRQQLQYGKNTLNLYFKHGRLAKGDEITDMGMNIQPVLLLSALAFLVLGVVPWLRVFWAFSGLILLAIAVYFFYSTVKIAAKFHDWSAMRLFVLYWVRSAAWFVGAILTTVHYLKGGTDSSAS